MSRPVIVSDEAFAALCEMAAVARDATGRVPSFAEMLDWLLKGDPGG